MSHVDVLGVDKMMGRAACERRRARPSLGTPKSNGCRSQEAEKERLEMPVEKERMFQDGGCFGWVEWC